MKTNFTEEKLPDLEAPALEWALYYANLGIKVFPVKTGTKDDFYCNNRLRGKASKKFPAGNPYSWEAQATTDREEIIKAFTEHQNANIGGATGNGFYAVDVDEREDGSGSESIRKWIENRTLPNGFNFNTWTSITGSGSRQYFYYLSDEQEKSMISKGIKYPGTADVIENKSKVDTRGIGRYVILPPSIHPNGNRYKWDDIKRPGVTEIAPFDRSVEILFKNSNKKPPKASGKVVKENGKRVPHGAREKYMTSRAGELVKKMGETCTDEIIVAALMQIARDELEQEPPFDYDELQAHMEDAVYRFRSQDEAKENADYRKEHNFKGRKVVELVTDEDLIMPVLADIEEKEIEWLIPGAIPKGCITILCSDGGIGKTSIWCDTLAKLTKGEKTIFEYNGSDYDSIPFGGRRSQSLMYFSKEDSTEMVLKKKIRVAGADMSKITCLGLDNDRVNKIWYGSLLLEKLIEKYVPDIVVFDTLQSFLPEGVEMSNRKEMRDSLTPLNTLGAKYGTTFLIISHTNKSNNNARRRMADSSDIWDIGRSVFMAGYTNDEGVLYLSHEKSNYSKMQKTILFRHSNECGIEFVGVTNKKDRDFQSEQQTAYGSPKKDEAKNFILEQLEEVERIEINEIESIGKAAGIKPNTLQEARSELVRDKIIDRICEGYGTSKKWYLLLHTKTYPK